MSKTAQELLEQTLNIISNEINKLANSSKSEKKSLSRTESQILTDYTKTLITYTKNEREEAQAEDLFTKSDDELDALAKEALDYLSSIDKKVELDTKDKKKKTVKKKKVTKKKGNK